MEAKGLKDHIEYTEEFKINLEDKKEGKTVDVTFQVRTPCKEPEYITKKKSVIYITKIYPSFKLDGENINTSST